MQSQFPSMTMSLDTSSSPAIAPPTQTPVINPDDSQPLPTGKTSPKLSVIIPAVLVPVFVIAVILAGTCLWWRSRRRKEKLWTKPTTITTVYPHKLSTESVESRTRRQEEVPGNTLPIGAVEPFPHTARANISVAEQSQQSQSPINAKGKRGSLAQGEGQRQGLGEGQRQRQRQGSETGLMTEINNKLTVMRDKLERIEVAFREGSSQGGLSPGNEGLDTARVDGLPPDYVSHDGHP